MLQQLFTSAQNCQPTAASSSSFRRAFSSHMSFASGISELYWRISQLNNKAVEAFKCEDGNGRQALAYRHPTFETCCRFTQWDKSSSRKFCITSIQCSTFSQRGEEGTVLDRSAISAQNNSPVTLCGQQYGWPKIDSIGILGGVSALATVNFMKKLVEATLADKESENIPLVACCHIRFPEKVFPAASGEELPLSSQAKAVGNAKHSFPLSDLVRNRKLLEGAGAKCIVLPCHTSHLWFDEIVQGCSVPCLHIADCLADELKSLNLYPIEVGSKPKIGILGAETTLYAGIYRERLKRVGFDVVLPDQATMEHAVLPGIIAMQREDMEGARNLLRIAAQVLLVSGVNMVVLACHDMASAFPPQDPLLKRCIDPINSLAKATVRWVKSAELCE